MRKTLLVLAVVIVVASGCGDDDDADTATGTTTTAAGTDTSTTEEPSSTPSTDAAPADLPGERIDIFPYEDARLAVVGVEAGDVLNVRSVPGASAGALVELEPLTDDLTATGHNRQIEGEALWVEVDTGAEQGWVNGAFVAQLGATDDATARLYPDVADRPVAETLVQLADVVAAGAAGEGEPAPRVVVVDGPTVGDLGEVVVDVLGYPDDSIYGERLHLFAEEEGSDSFRLRTVEATTLCRRGVDAEGRCT